MAELTGFDGRVQAVLARLEAPAARLIGRGAEGLVYEYWNDRVVKIYQHASISALERLSGFLSLLARQALPYGVPQIFEIGRLDGTSFTIERRLPGETLEGRFSALSQDQQRQALTSYFMALEPMSGVELVDHPYGHVLPSHDNSDVITAQSWPAFLMRQIAQSLEKAGADLARDVEALSDKAQELSRLIRARLDRAPRRLVHADYFLGNVLFDRDLRVSALLDFGAHTLAGDPRLDVAGAIAFLTLDAAIRPWHIEYITTLAGKRYGRAIHPIIALYTLYYSIYYANTKTSAPLTYRWCARNLMDERLWQAAQ